MRLAILVSSLAFVLALQAPAYAQKRSPFRTINPGEVRNIQLDVSKALVAPAPQPATPTSSLKNFFGKFRLPSFLKSPQLGKSNLPKPQSFPSTGYNSPLKPVQPIP